MLCCHTHINLDVTCSTEWIRLIVSDQKLAAAGFKRAETPQYANKSFTWSSKSQWWMETICWETCHSCPTTFPSSSGRACQWWADLLGFLILCWQVSFHRAASHPAAFRQPSVSRGLHWQQQCGAKIYFFLSFIFIYFLFTNQAVALTDRMEIHEYFSPHESLVGPRRTFRVLHYAWRIPEYAPRGSQSERVH